MSDKELIEIKVLFEEAAKAFDTMGKKVDNFTSTIDKANSKLKDSEEKTTKSANSLQKAGESLSGFGQHLDSLGNKLLYFGASWSAGVSVPLQRFGQESIDVFLAVDKEWARMSKAVGEEIDSLQNKYGDLAAEISGNFGQSQALVIESFTEIAKAGFDSEEQIKALGLAAAKAAVNFDTDLAEATRLTIQMMSQWGWTIDNVQEGLSMVNEVADATATSELGLAQAFTIAGPAAKATGIEAEYLAAMIAAVQRKGFTAAKTGYALNSVFINLSTKTKDLSDALAVMGVKMSGAELKSKTNAERIKILADAYKDFRDKTQLSSAVIQDFAKQAESSGGAIKTNNKNMSDLANSIAGIAGKQHFPKLLALLDDMANGMDNSTSTISDFSKAMEVAGIGNDELAKIFDTKTNKALEAASAKWAQMQERINNAKIEIGKLILVALIPLMDAFKGLLDRFNALDDTQKEQIVKWGLIAAAIGPVAVVMASLVKALALINGASGLGGMLTLLGNITAVVGAGPFVVLVGALAGIIFWVQKLGEAFQKNFLDKIKPETFSGITSAWNSLVDGIKKGFGMINEQGAENSFMDMIGKGLENLAEKLNKVDWKKVGEGAQIIGKVLGVLGKIVVIIFKVIGALALFNVWVASMSGVIGDWLRKTVGDFIKWYSETKQKADQWKSDMLAKIAEWGQGVWNTITGWFSTIITSFSTWVSDTQRQFDAFVEGTKFAINQALEPFMGFFAAIKQLFMAIENLHNVLEQAVAVIWGRIVEAFMAKWNEIWAFIQPILTQIKDYIVAGFTWAAAGLATIWEGIKVGAQAAWNWLITNVFAPIGSFVSKYIIEPFNNAKTSAIAKFKELVDGAKTKFDEMKTGISDKIVEIKTTIKTKMDDAVKGITDKVGQAKTWGQDMIQGFINGITTKVKQLTDTINWVASEIQRRLGFSVPEMGPLSKADTWMPDFIDLMTKGLNKGVPQMMQAVNAVASQVQSIMNPNTMLNTLGGNASLNFTPIADTRGFASEIGAQMAVPINAAMPQQNVVQVHKHFEFKPGVSIATDSEAREFVRKLQKIEAVENLRTSSSNVTEAQS